MSLIKNDNDIFPAGSGLVKADEAKAVYSALDNVRKLEDEARNRLAQAIEDAHRRQEEAYKEGFRQGEGATAAALLNVEKERQALRNDAQLYAETLVSTAIEHLLQDRQITLSAALAVQTAREAVAAVAHRSGVRLLLNPADRPIIEETIGEWSRMAGGMTIELIDDASLPCGRCMAQSAAGQAETDLGALLEVLTNDIKENFKKDDQESDTETLVTDSPIDKKPKETAEESTARPKAPPSPPIQSFDDIDESEEQADDDGEVADSDEELSQMFDEDFLRQLFSEDDQNED